MFDVVTVFDDGDDVRRAPQGVMLAVWSQFLTAFGTNCFLRLIPTKWHFFDIFHHAIWHSHFISNMFCNSFWHSIWYMFGDSLWLRSGGQDSDHKVRWFCCCCCCCCWRCCCCCYCCCCCCFLLFCLLLFLLFVRVFLFFVLFWFFLVVLWLFFLFLLLLLLLLF